MLPDDPNFLNELDAEPTTPEGPARVLVAAPDSPDRSALRLWHQYRAGQEAALDQLVRYNAADTRNLEPLAACLYEQLVVRYGPPAPAHRG